MQVSMQDRKRRRWEIEKTHDETRERKGVNGEVGNSERESLLLPSSRPVNREGHIKVIHTSIQGET